MTTQVQLNRIDNSQHLSRTIHLRTYNNIFNKDGSTTMNDLKTNNINRPTYFALRHDQVLFCKELNIIYACKSFGTVVSKTIPSYIADKIIMGTETWVNVYEDGTEEITFLVAQKSDGEPEVKEEISINTRDCKIFNNIDGFIDEVLNREDEVATKSILDSTGLSEFYQKPMGEIKEEEISETPSTQIDIFKRLEV